MKWFIIVLVLIVCGRIVSSILYMSDKNINEQSITTGLLGRWIATSENGNGKILGEEIEFLDENGKKILNIYNVGKIIESYPWEENEQHGITLKTKLGDMRYPKYRINFIKNDKIGVDYLSDGHSLEEPATGFYKKVSQ